MSALRKERKDRESEFGPSVSSGAPAESSKRHCGEQTAGVWPAAVVAQRLI